MSEEQDVPCECRRCTRCKGTGEEHWYLGDEFNSQGISECGTCEGTGVIIDDCPLHYMTAKRGSLMGSDYGHERDGVRQQLAVAETENQLWRQKAVLFDQREEQLAAANERAAKAEKMYGKILNDYADQATRLTQATEALREIKNECLWPAAVRVAEKALAAIDAALPKEKE